jgi:hypothetical protein
MQIVCQMYLVINHIQNIYSKQNDNLEINIQAIVI